MPSSRLIVGRLLELDLETGFRSIAEVDAFSSSIAVALGNAPPEQKLVLVADWRRYQVAIPEVAERVSAMVQRNSPLFERNAVLYGAQAPTGTLQLFRVMQEAYNPQRRMFTDPGDLTSWLDEVLDSRERDRLRAFLRAGSPE